MSWGSVHKDDKTTKHKNIFFLMINEMSWFTDSKYLAILLVLAEVNVKILNEIKKPILKCALETI